MAKKWTGAELIRQRLSHVDLNQAAFCKMNGLNHGAFRKFISTGRTNKRLAKSFSKALGISLEDFLAAGAVLTSERESKRSAYLPMPENLILSGEELRLLAEAQKVLGDLSLKMIVEIVKNRRAQS
ncbi:MAG: hypothetical protein HYT47_01810 [Candidatus Vogelbacteria bacterium]|nr:hypothetical protein [Candidatus Vogelbacteria bacterium]